MKNQKTTIVLDTETTGLSPLNDEMLQLSIIDGEGNKLFDELLKPTKNKSWKEAEKINHISPRMVADKYDIDYYHDEVQEILNSADCIIGYNTDFDLAFLRFSKFEIPQCKIIDVMLMYSKNFGKWNDYYRDYKWEKLTTASAHYKFQWKEDAHNSLGDCKATLYVYKKLLEDGIYFNECSKLNHYRRLKFKGK